MSFRNPDKDIYIFFILGFSACGQENSAHFPRSRTEKMGDLRRDTEERTCSGSQKKKDPYFLLGGEEPKEEKAQTVKQAEKL